MTNQLPDRPSKPKRCNGKGTNVPELQDWTEEWDVSAPTQSMPRDASGFPLKQDSSTNNGRWDKFPQPRGWSLQWDGSSIAAIQEFKTRQTPPTVRNTPADESASTVTQD